MHAIRESISVSESQGRRVFGNVFNAVIEILI